MRRNTPIAHQLYASLYPKPTTHDPSSFSAHLAKNLIPEVRIEVATFYGDLNSIEARYPGLDYCYSPHRMRLGRFKYHKRLFDAFDGLGLTSTEIQEFCCWEGTKWARERYEQDEGVKVMDTTGDEIGPYVDRRELRAEEAGRRHSITRKTDISVIVEDARTVIGHHQALLENDEDMNGAQAAANNGTNDEDNESGQETPQQSAAREDHISELNRRRDNSIINQRLIAAWERGESLPADVEQYLKEQSERGTLNEDLSNILRRNAWNGYLPLPSTSSSSSSAPSGPSQPRAAA